MEYSERYGQQGLPEDLYDHCRRLLGDLALQHLSRPKKRNTRDNAFVYYYPGKFTKEQLAADWEKAKEIMDNAIPSFPNDTWSKTVDKLKTADQEFLSGVITSIRQRGLL